MLKTATAIAAALAVATGAARAADGQASQPLEVKLVAIDTGRMPEPGSLQVKRAAAAVRAAQARCTTQGEKLAGQALTISQEVQKQGQVASTVEVLEGLDAVLVDVKGRSDCAPILASYATLRRDGATHSRAVVMQRALLKLAAAK